MKDGKEHWRILCAVSCTIVAIGIILEPSLTLLRNITLILKSPDQLLTDYLKIGGLSASLVNAGLVGIIGSILVAMDKAAVTGPIIAGYCTMIGFSFFGKNFLNVLPIIIGVLLYARFRRHPHSFTIIAMFSTAMAPIVSQLAFQFHLGMPIAVVAGIAIGFLAPPIATQMLRSHQGFDLYNLGYTAGFIGTLAASMLRAFDSEPETTLIWSTAYTKPLSVSLILICFVLIAVGLYLNRRAIKDMRYLLKHPGALVTDFVILEGMGTTLVNMGIMGMLALVYVFLAGGPINGPVLGGILTIIGFSAFGKHPFNSIPVMAGVFLLASISPVWEPSQPGPLLAGLFVTCLAPVSGLFGPIYGIIAGTLHLSVVMSVSYLHSGLNLYNNGFAAGIVATVMVGILKAFKPEVLED